jgi:hypothetical protein
MKGTKQYEVSDHVPDLTLWLRDLFCHVNVRVGEFPLVLMQVAETRILQPDYL